MIAATVAAAGAVTLGPVSLRLAHSCMRDSWRPSRPEVVAMTTLAGLMVLSAADWLWTAPAALPLAIAGPAAAVVDAREGRLPDRLTIPLCVATALITVFCTSDSTGSLIAAVVVTSAAAVIAIVAGSLLGWGDVKLLPTVALVLGAHGALSAGLAAVLVLLALTATAVWVCDRRALVPYGPALVVGTLVTVGMG